MPMTFHTPPERKGNLIFSFFCGVSFPFFWLKIAGALLRQTVVTGGHIRETRASQILSTCIRQEIRVQGTRFLFFTGTCVPVCKGVASLKFICHA